MSFNVNFATGLLGTAVGFVVLAEGVKLLSSAEKHVYKKNGYKIHPIPKGRKAQNNLIGKIKMPNINLNLDKVIFNG